VVSVDESSVEAVEPRGPDTTEVIEFRERKQVHLVSDAVHGRRQRSAWYTKLLVVPWWVKPAVFTRLGRVEN
jgi:hypothetical protein